jgi:hypothetical protein
MGLKELLAAGIIAFSPAAATAQDGKPEQSEEDLDSLIKEAGRLFARNNPYKPGVPGDREKAIPLLERIVKRSNEEGFGEILLHCRRTAASEKFNEAQRLWAFDQNQQDSIRKDYQVKTKEESREAAKKLYKDSILQLKHILEADPDTNPKEWWIKGTAHARFGEWDSSADCQRNYLKRAPGEVEAYKSLFIMLYQLRKTGSILDDLEKINLDEKEKISNLVKGMHSAYDEARSLKILVRVRAETKEDRLKAAKLFYLSSKIGWDEEMKKENANDRNFIYPMHDVMRAGSFDLLAAETDEERAAAFKRFEQAYEAINKGMDNAFGELSKYYKFIILTRKSVPMADGEAEKVHEMLKQRYEK